MFSRVAKCSDISGLQESIKQNLRQAGLEPIDGTNPLTFEGGFVPGRPGLLLRGGTVTLEALDSATVAMRARVRLHFVGYLILGIVAVLVDLVLFLVGNDVVFFAVAVNALLLYVPVYWKMKALELEKAILQLDSAPT